MVISSVYICFWCPDLTCSIYTIHINTDGCSILLDTKEDIPSAFTELLGMNQNKEAQTYCS